MQSVIGIDEVGRGPLAGPVVVAALSIPKNFFTMSRREHRALGALKDSKKLSRKKREAWFAYLTRHPCVRYAVARVMPQTIDRVNIARAANRAALRAYERLIENDKGGAAHRPAMRGTPSRRAAPIYLDGGLYLGTRVKSEQHYHAKTVIKGDEKIRAVAMASIIAKVTRDRAMVRLAKRYPDYGFEVHKGYGTRLHRAALTKHGPSPVHRLTFIA